MADMSVVLMSVAPHADAMHALMMERQSQWTAGFNRAGVFVLSGASTAYIRLHFPAKINPPSVAAAPMSDTGSGCVRPQRRL